MCIQCIASSTYSSRQPASADSKGFCFNLITYLMFLLEYNEVCIVSTSLLSRCHAHHARKLAFSERIATFPTILIRGYLMLFPRERINDDDELYPQYWSEFESYYPHHGVPFTAARNTNVAYYFHMESFETNEIDLGVYLLDDNTSISANIFLNKEYDKAESIFEVLKSAKAYFQKSFEDKLLFLERRSVFIIGCRKRGRCKGSQRLG